MATERLFVFPYQLLGNVFRGVRYTFKRYAISTVWRATSSQYLKTYIGYDFKYNVIQWKLFEAGLHFFGANSGNTVVEAAATEYIP